MQTLEEFCTDVIALDIPCAAGLVLTHFKTKHQMMQGFRINLARLLQIRYRQIIVIG